MRAFCPATSSGPSFSERLVTSVRSEATSLSVSVCSLRILTVLEWALVVKVWSSALLGGGGLADVVVLVEDHHAEEHDHHHGAGDQPRCEPLPPAPDVLRHRSSRPR